MTGIVVGFCGEANVGKDTAADFLVKNHGFVKVALADPLKRICKEVYGFSDNQLWGPSKERNKPDERYPRILIESLDDPSLKRVECLTPRYALQKLGTEWGRDCYKNTWVNYCRRVAEKLLDGPSHEYNYYSAAHGLTFVGGYQQPRGVVISDVRFRNEIDAIHAAGGKVVKIVRPASRCVWACDACCKEKLG